MFHRVFEKRKRGSSKSATRSPIRHGRGPGRSPLALESLETRLVMSCDFTMLQSEVQTFLTTADNALGAVIGVADAKLPIINKSLSQLTGAGGADQAIKGFKDGVDQALAAIQSNALDSDVQKLLDQYLGAGGANVELSPSQVHLKTVNDPATADVVDVTLHLGKTLGHTEAQFGLGLASLPFSAKGTAYADLNFKMDLKFGFDKDCSFFVTPGQLDLHAAAGLKDASLTGQLGFLEFSGKTNPAGNTGFAGDFLLPFGSSLQQPVSAPKLTGSADVNLLLEAGFANAQVAAPSISTNFVMHWQFNTSQVNTSDSSFGNALSVGFQNVQVNLGSYLTQMVGPVVEKVQQFTEPFKDFFHLLGEPVPVISDLAKFIGKKDGVSILDMAGIVANSGQIPPNFSTLITIAKDVIQVTNVLDAIKLQDQQNGGKLLNSEINLGNFDAVANQLGGADLRDLVSAVSFGDVTSKDWSKLQMIVDNIDLNSIKKQINAVLGDKLGNALGDAFDNLKQAANNGLGNNSASIDLSFPITDHPASAIFGLLVGQDTDLVSFTAKAKIDGSSNLPIFKYNGFEIDVTGGIQVDAYLRLAFDTYGLREVGSQVFNGQNPDFTKLVDGFYVDSQTHLHIGGSIGIQGGVNLTLLQAYIAGHLDATVDVTIPQPTPPKIRPFDLGVTAGAP